MKNVQDRIMVALDFPEYEPALDLAERLMGRVGYMKIGMELYFAAGPKLVESLKKLGFHVFVDLKIHDIPNTAKGATASLAKLGVDMINLHVAGGLKMLYAAKDGLEIGSVGHAHKPLLIGVTQLTSTAQDTLNNEIGIHGDIADAVMHYATLAKIAGLDGVVSSAHEVKGIKEKCGNDFITVTPGIRLPDAKIEDQSRIATPEDAFRTGTDYIVIGRPITQAKDPVKALDRIVKRCEEI